MADLNDSFDDDESIVKVTPSLCTEDMEISDYGFVFPPNYILPDAMTVSQAKESPHQQLQDILKENNELRDSLVKNNTDMRQLLAAFREYQDKTLQSRAIHKQRIEGLWKDNQQIQSDRERLGKECQELQAKMLEKQTEFQKVQEYLSSSQTSCASLEDQLKTSKDELQRSEVLILTNTSQIKEMESVIEQLKLSTEKATNQNEALMEQLEKQRTVFQGQLEAAELRNKTSENALQLLREDQQKQQSQLLKQNGDLERLAGEKQALMEKIEAFRDEMVTAGRQHAELNDQLSSLHKHKSALELSEHQVREQLQEAQKQVLDLQAEVKDLEDEKAKLLLHTQAMNQTPEEDMGFALVNQEIINSISDSSLQRKLQEQETYTCELNKTIAEQKEQLEKLENELQTKGQTGNQDDEIARHFSKAQTPSNLTTAIIQQYEDRYQSLGEQLGACQERLQFLQFEESSALLQDGLKKEIEVLKQLLEQERAEKATDRKNFELQIEQVSQSYRQILASWEIYENDQKTKGRQNEALSAIEKRQHQERLDELMAQNVSLEEETQAKDRELSSLKGQISVLNRETEHVPILRAQVEVYRQDFSRERDEKAKAEATVDMLRQEINSLHTQLSELRDELNVFNDQQRRELNYHQEQRRSELSSSLEQSTEEASAPQEGSQVPSSPPLVEEFVVPQSRKVIVKSYRPTDSDRDSRRRRGRHHGRSRSPEPDSFTGSNGRMTYDCPRCRMSYTTVAAVENHLEGCLREDGPYP